MSLLDVLTLLLFVAGSWDLAGGRVDRLRYGTRRFRKIGWALILAALLTRFLLGGEGWTAALLAVSRDLGAGLILASYRLMVKKARPRAWFVIGLVLVAIWAGAQLRERVFSKTELLVELGPDDRVEEIQAILDAHGARFEQAFPNVSLDEDADLAQYYLASCPTHRAEALVASLRADAENVDSVSINAPVQLIEPLEGEESSEPASWDITNDPQATVQWGLTAVRASEALDLLKRSRPARVGVVAIVDTGVDSSHEDLAAVFQPSPGTRDGHGHGSHCAGIAGAAANNGLGIASLNYEGRYLRIAGYPALSPGGWGTVESISQAIIDAAEDGVDVISLSLGGHHPDPPKAEVDAIEYALRLGVIVVAAAGNNRSDARYHAPANIPGVIVVAASDPQDHRASFSNTNTSLGRPIAAPGVNILSLAPGSDYRSLSGTSMAAPMVSGLLGVMRSLEPELSAADAYAILERTGRRVDDSAEIGRIIDMAAAIREVIR